MDASPYTAPEAREAGLVDRLGYRDEVYAVDPVAVPDHAGAAVRRPVEAGPSALLAEAAGVVMWRWSRRAGRSSPAGPGAALGGRQVGSDTVSAQLRAAREDDSARAVVLRVDSPGGSAVASEVIWREVVRLRDAGEAGGGLDG